ncbi:MAG: DUF4185 domain-containing protein [Candidatus Bipolaricaulota bacterium]
MRQRSVAKWVFVAVTIAAAGMLAKTAPELLEPRYGDLRSALAGCDRLLDELGEALVKELVLDDPNGITLYRFYSFAFAGDVYVAWSNTGRVEPIRGLTGLAWSLDCGTRGKLGSGVPRAVSDIGVGPTPTALLPCTPSSPVIASIALAGPPIRPFKSSGDLWMSTWADDGALYTGWGDGFGVDPLAHEVWSDCGIACLTGSLPKLSATEVCYIAPTSEPEVNDKPSSLLSIDGRLVGAFHSPLGDAWIGYLAYSDDYGHNWTRVGYHDPGDPWSAGASPWVRDACSAVRCLCFIQMGQDYELNTDGYVYALGIGTEWSWMGPVRLTRVPVASILDYDAYQYCAGLDPSGDPIWSHDERRAVPLPGVRASEQGSAMFHPQLKRYLFLTNPHLYDAPTPWGPWTYAGTWTGVGTDAPIEWFGGYQPGIISKDTESNAFWFTLSGQNEAPQVEYMLSLGRIEMTLRPLQASGTAVP